jgi:hypothetical protein
MNNSNHILNALKDLSENVDAYETAFQKLRDDFPAIEGAVIAVADKNATDEIRYTGLAILLGVLVKRIDTLEAQVSNLSSLIADKL